MECRLPEEFKYEYFNINRYLMPKFKPNEIEYEAMCNNGFIKLYTIPGKIYWLLQNELCHSTPDWKFHVSVKDCDVPRAWNIIAEIFLQKKCKSSIKVKYIKENPNVTRGREITIYITIYDDIYDKSEVGKEFNFNRDIQQSGEFWYDMFSSLESSLTQNNIKSNGVANGDLALGDYISFRNEAFIPEKNIDIYPPDWAGWNAKNHTLPFCIKRLQTRKKQSISLRFLIIAILSVFILIASFWAF